VFVDRRLVEGIDPICLGLSSRGADLLGPLLEALQGSTGEEDPAPSRANARATAPPMAPPALQTTAFLFSSSISILLSGREGATDLVEGLGPMPCSRDTSASPTVVNCSSRTHPAPASARCAGLGNPLGRWLPTLRT
jgi:hypothetical protein